MVETMAASSNMSKQITAIRQSAKRFRLRGRSISTKDSRIPKYVLKELGSLVREKHDAFIASIQDIDIQKDHSMKVYYNKTMDGKWRIYFVGPQVIYDEFGTGTLGERSAVISGSEHPAAKRANIKPYNSGYWNSQLVDFGGHYWYYEGLKSYGQPMGRFIFDSYQEYANGLAVKKAKEQMKRDLAEANKMNDSGEGGVI